MSFRKILIAVDSGPVAANAAGVGADLARSLGAEVALITTVDTSSDFGGETGVSPKELLEQVRQEGKRLLAGFRKRLSLDASALEFVQQGAPSDEIVKAAKEWPADLIVIGSHGRGGITRALVGSVAEGVMRQAPCPVLVVRAKA